MPTKEFTITFLGLWDYAQDLEGLSQEMATFIGSSGHTRMEIDFREQILAIKKKHGVPVDEKDEVVPDNEDTTIDTQPKPNWPDA